MPSKFLSCILFLASSISGFSQNPATDYSKKEFKVITVLESIVPMGIGRSRIIDSNAELDAENFTTQRTEEDRNPQREIQRKSLKTREVEETALLNFYSLPGINIENIASNDALIGSKINNLLKEGWTLEFITSGVESDSGKDDGKGIFITRMYFSRIL